MNLSPLRKIVCHFAIVSLLGTFTATAGDQPASARKLNICFLLADDLIPNGLASLGNPVVKTPNLDKLVEGGFIFRCAYTQGSHIGAVCLPSRTMIQTGQSYLRPKTSTPTWAHTLQAAGYATIRSGKSGNNPNELDKNFDQHLHGNHSEGDADNLIAFIHAQAGKRPLFLYMASDQPHDPQFAPDSYYPMYKPADIPLPMNFLPYHPFDNGDMTVRDEKTLPWPRTKENVTGKLARYYASTSYWDAQAGRVIAALKAAGQFDNTLFVIAGDNGLSLGEHGLLGKQNLYEFGGMHVPLVFSGPGIPKGQTQAFAYLMDIYPTLCELTGVAIPPGLDAKSLAPVITGKAPSVRDVCFTSYMNNQRAVRNSRWKLIRYPLINKTQLFDLQADPHEMADLSAKPECADNLNAMLASLKQEQLRYGDNCPLTVAHPTPAEWHPPSNAQAKGNGSVKIKKSAPALTGGEKKTRVLLVTGGHDFDAAKFYKLFDGLKGVEYTKVAYPQAAELLKPGLEKQYDAIVMYDMVHSISPVQQKALVDLLNVGIGLVCLHHDLGAHQDWPEFLQIRGGKYFLNAETLDGEERKSTYAENQDMAITVVDREHPITKGLQDFSVKDEVYGNCYVLPSMHVLLKTSHPMCMPEVAWVHSYGKSRVFYLMLGHGPSAWENPAYPELLQRGILWTSQKP